MTVQLPAGAVATAQLYYQDTTAGIATLSAMGAAVAWTIEPQSRGTVSPVSGATASVVASSVPGTGTVTGTLTTPTAQLTATTALTVRPMPAVRVSAVRYGVARGRLLVFTTVVDTRGARVRNASVTVALSRNGKQVGTATGRTTSGRMTLTRTLASGRYTARVTRVVAPGYSWSGSTPANGFRRR